jgi:hypothetical protein
MRCGPGKESSQLRRTGSDTGDGHRSVRSKTQQRFAPWRILPRSIRQISDEATVRVMDTDVPRNTSGRFEQWINGVPPSGELW